MQILLLTKFGSKNASIYAILSVHIKKEMSSRTTELRKYK